MQLQMKLIPKVKKQINRFWLQPKRGVEHKSFCGSSCQAKGFMDQTFTIRLLLKKRYRRIELKLVREDHKIFYLNQDGASTHG